jgi:hypothetical protein
LPRQLLFPTETVPAVAWEPYGLEKQMQLPPPDPPWTQIPLEDQQRAEVRLSHCGRTWGTSGAGVAHAHHQGKPLLS